MAAEFTSRPLKRLRRATQECECGIQEEVKHEGDLVQKDWDKLKTAHDEEKLAKMILTDRLVTLMSGQNPDDVHKLMRTWEKEDQDHRGLAGVYRQVYNKFEQATTPKKQAEMAADRMNGIIVKNAVIEFLASDTP